jgi:hypothetical protein
MKRKTFEESIETFFDDLKILMGKMSENSDWRYWHRAFRRFLDEKLQPFKCDTSDVFAEITVGEFQACDLIAKHEKANGTSSLCSRTKELIELHSLLEVKIEKVKFVIGRTCDLFGRCSMNDSVLYNSEFIGDYGLEFCQPVDILLLYSLARSDDFPKCLKLMTRPLKYIDNKDYYLEIVEYNEGHPYHGQRNIIATETSTSISITGACYRVFRLKE